MPSIQTELPGYCALRQGSQQMPLQAVGIFKLLPGVALTFASLEPVELRVTHGSVWLTFDNAAQDASVCAGDHFLEAGAVFQLACGQKVVVETLGLYPDAAADLSWTPVAALSVGLALSPARLQHASVRQALLDLGNALNEAGRALVRLVQGLASSLVDVLMRRRKTL